MATNAKEIIEDILNREQQKQIYAKLRCYEEYKELDGRITFEQYKNDQSIIFLPKDMPEIINNGNTQAVIKLNNEYVAKVPIITFSNYYMVSEYPKVITDSMKTWRELGFDVPQHIFYYMNTNEKIQLSEQYITKYDNPRVAITKDFTKNGHMLKTYDNNIINNLGNADQIMREFEEGFHRIKHIYKNPDEYLIQPTGHLDDDGSINTAITHLFLVQINKKTNKGKLVLGDLDHLFLYKYTDVE